jgi:hypothetical protein
VRIHGASCRFVKPIFNAERALFGALASGGAMPQVDIITGEKRVRHDRGHLVKKTIREEMLSS